MSKRLCTSSKLLVQDLLLLLARINIFGIVVERLAGKDLFKVERSYRQAVGKLFGHLIKSIIKLENKQWFLDSY